ncbi:acyl carrier protein [Scytonema sp. NUACC21]
MQQNQVNPVKADNSSQAYSEVEIQNWLISYMIEQLKIDSTRLDITVPYDRYGLDSTILIGMVADIEDWLGCSLPPTLVYNYPTIQSLAEHLFSQIINKKFE